MAQITLIAQHSNLIMPTNSLCLSSCSVRFWKYPRLIHRSRRLGDSIAISKSQEYLPVERKSVETHIWPVCASKQAAPLQHLQEENLYQGRQQNRTSRWGGDRTPHSIPKVWRQSVLEECVCKLVRSLLLYLLLWTIGDSIWPKFTTI